MTGRTEPLEGIPCTRSDFRDAMNMCPSVPHKHARAGYLLAWKGKDVTAGQPMLVVTVSAQTLAAEMAISKANAVGILQDLVFNGWLMRGTQRSQFIATVPPLEKTGVEFDRAYGETRYQLVMQEEWATAPKKKTRSADDERERLAALAEKRRARAAETQTVRTPDRNGQDPYPVSVRTHDQERSGPMTDERSGPLTETVRTHDQTADRSLYRPHPRNRTPHPEPLPTGGTLPSVATAGGHPVPRPPALDSQGADEIPSATRNLAWNPGPQTAYARDAREAEVEGEGTEESPMRIRLVLDGKLPRSRWAS